MKKVLSTKYMYEGKQARITCIIEDINGYISITGAITPYRCRSAHVCGCIHDEIIKAFEYFDINHSGKIHITDLTRILSTFGEVINLISS